MEKTNLEQPTLARKLHGEDVSQTQNLEDNLSKIGSNEQGLFEDGEQLDSSKIELLTSQNGKEISSVLPKNSQHDFAQSEESQSKMDDDFSQKFGKFKDAKTLFEAYNNLQSDYTKKCQALAQLQKAVQEKSTPNIRSAMPSASIFEEPQPVQKPALSKEEKENVLEEFIFANPNLKDKFLARYFDEINLPQSPKLIGSDRGSSFVLSPQNRPKTLDEAGRIAKEIFNKQD